MAYEQKDIRQAFQTWRQFNRNVEKTVRELRREYPHLKNISVPTVSSWRDKYDWNSQADRLDLLEQKFDSEIENVELILLQELGQSLKDLVAGKIHVDRPIEKIYAEVKVAHELGTIVNRRRQADHKIDRRALFLELLEFELRYLTEQGETELVEALAQHLDGMGAAIDKEYAS